MESAKKSDSTGMMIIDFSNGVRVMLDVHALLRDGNGRRFIRAMGDTLRRGLVTKENLEADNRRRLERDLLIAQNAGDVIWNPKKYAHV
ncbi:MAG: hypothetical protein J7K54_04825 [Candidatus Aenigmarchaeota archaeon]|nr:hypothetical protein [Candidatus Aenigmarchaeota archaeon]